MDRRRFCTSSASLALLATTIGVTGCRERAADLRLLKSQGSVDFPLVVDTHAHTFNGSDLQVSKFIAKVAVNEVDSTAIRFIAEMFGPVLQFIAWNFAPSASRESKVLRGYISSQIEQAEFEENTIQSQDDQYQIAKRELERATIEAIEANGESVERYREPIESMGAEQQAFASLLAMPNNYEQLHSGDLEEAALTEHLKRVRSAQRFLVEMFQYRHVSTINYFNTYLADEIAVDLMVPCLVDYDWWLGRGQPTKSSLLEQITVNESISALSHGRVHPFAPFDPFRQLMWNEYQVGDFSPIEIVKDAVENRGFLGVKLYPPMGFGVYGNGTIQRRDEPVWHGKEWLHPISQSPQFGTKLDRALAELYEYCAANDVAVMAHSNPSNLADRDYAPLLGIQHWEALYESFAISGSYGHFNGLGSGGDAERWQKFVDLLNSEATSNRRFADASYFTKALSDQDWLVPVLRSVVFQPDGTPSPILQKMMYGSDWKMLLMEVDAAAYLTSMMAVLERADEQLVEMGFSSSLVNNVMGQNAAEFLGLRRGRPARGRLERFYEKYKIDEPLWMKKVDQGSNGSV